MKLSSVLALLFVYMSLVSISQNHPTIESLTVNYKLPNTVVIDTSSSGVVKALPEATIKLFSVENISRIYFKIITSTEHTVLYEVNYSANSAEILNSGGMIVFSKQGTTLLVNSPFAFSLTPYIYEIVTEDNEGNLSPIFSEIH